MDIENNIGDEGAKVLGEALKYNSVLTELNLDCMKTIDLLILRCELANY